MAMNLVAMLLIVVAVASIALLLVSGFGLSSSSDGYDSQPTFSTPAAAAAAAAMVGVHVELPPDASAEVVQTFTRLSSRSKDPDAQALLGGGADPELVHPQSALPQFFTMSATEELRSLGSEGCPSNYPPFTALGPLMYTWSPNDPEGAGWGNHGRNRDVEPFPELLRVFDWRDRHQRDLAERYRNCELPFKIDHAEEIQSVVDKWDDKYLSDAFHPDKGRHSFAVKYSKNNKFLFYKMSGKVVPRGWESPTKFVDDVSFDSWQALAKVADSGKLEAEYPHYYLTASCPAKMRTPISPSMSTDTTGSFIADDLPFLSTKTDNFWISNARRQKGIQCRFGMRGVVAESHYDSGRNFVVMLRGSKRYVLNPPSECPVLGVIGKKEHPSYRHSELDWSNPIEWPKGFQSAKTVDTVVMEGQALYIPSYWFHYIVSTNYSIQCNARSGSPPRREGWDDIQRCFADLDEDAKKKEGGNRAHAQHDSGAEFDARTDIGGGGGGAKGDDDGEPGEGDAAKQAPQARQTPS